MHLVVVVSSSRLNDLICKKKKKIKTKPETNGGKAQWICPVKSSFFPARLIQHVFSPQKKKKKAATGFLLVKKQQQRHKAAAEKKKKRDSKLNHDLAKRGGVQHVCKD